MEKNNFKYKHTLLLYLICEGYKAGVISDDEKIKMKTLIMSNYDGVYKLLEDYEKDGNIQHFWSAFKDLTFKTFRNYSSNQSFSTEENSLSSLENLSGIEEPSSPPDTALLRKKKRNLTRTRTEEGIKDMESTNTSSTFGSLEKIVKRCKTGLSPKVDFKSI